MKHKTVFKRVIPFHSKCIIDLEWLCNRL